MNALARGPERVVVLVGAVGFVVAARIVRLLSRGDPDVARLMAAPVDDEPLSEEAEARIKKALEQIKAGRGVPFEQAFPDGETAL